MVSGRCAAHAQARDRRRGTARQRGYTAKWDRASRRFLRRYPLCGMRPEGQAPVLSVCHAEGRVTASTDVDHVVPHRGDQGLMWDERGNWQALCGACHKRKTGLGY